MENKELKSVNSAKSKLVCHLNLQLLTMGHDISLVHSDNDGDDEDVPAAGAQNTASDGANSWLIDVSNGLASFHDQYGALPHHEITTFSLRMNEGELIFGKG